MALACFGASGVTAIRPIGANVWLAGDRVLKRTASAERAERVAYLSRQLHAGGVPVAACVDRRRTDLPDRSLDRYILMEYCPGAALSADDLVERPEAAEDLGAALFRLHGALRRIEKMHLFPENDLAGELTDAVDTLARRGVALPEQLLEACFALVPRYSRLPRQVIHRDVQPRNLLFRQERLACFLDLDSSAVDARVYDLAYLGLTTLHGLTYEEGRTLGRWRRFVSAVLRGYTGQGALEPAERACLGPLFYALEVCFLAYYADTDLDRQLRLLRCLWREGQSAALDEL